MSGPILHRLVLVLRVLFSFTSDTIHKSSEISDVFSEEALKLVPGDWCGFIAPSFLLELLLSDSSVQEQGCKGNLVQSFSPNYFKIVFILLAKPIAIHMKIASVEIWKPSLEGLILRLCFALSWLSLKIYINFYELFEKFIGRS